MRVFLKIFIIFLLSSCANIVAPDGGDKDLDSPKLLNTEITENLKNKCGKTIIFEFDEYIRLNKWDEYFYISPPIIKRPQKKIKGQSLIITIDDSLNKNSTYYLALNSCIKDNNEGNILDSLSYKFSTDENFDTLTLSGNLYDAYTLKPLESTWIMLFDIDLNDTLIFKNTPDYIAQTNKKGIFHFPNLKVVNYKVVALTGTDFIYNLNEKIAFLDDFVNAKTDSFISLFAFNPIVTIDNLTTDSTTFKSDTISTFIDSVSKKEELSFGRLKVITEEASPCMFQLFQNEKLVYNFYFSDNPYSMDAIIPGRYRLKYITDTNYDSVWNTGNWENRLQPEKVLNYPSEILIRSNWDLELEWIIGE